MNMNYNELKKELNDTMLVIVSKKRTIEQIKNEMNNKITQYITEK